MSSACVSERKGVEVSSSRTALLSQLQHAAAVAATAGCVLSSAQLNTLEKVSAVRSQRPVQAERSVFAGRLLPIAGANFQFLRQ